MAKKSTVGKEIVLAVYNTQDADSASAALVKADIEYVRRKIGAGKHGNFLMALNNYGEEIFVSPEDVEKAKQVLEEWRAKKNERIKRQQESEQSGKETEDRQQQKKVLYARILAGIVLAAVIVLYLMQRS